MGVLAKADDLFADPLSDCQSPEDILSKFASESAYTTIKTLSQGQSMAF
jgi:hypothetical protein